MQADRPAPPSRPFDRVAAAVVVVSTAVFGWVLTLGRPDLLASRPMSDLFDIQGRALLHGHLSGPRGTYGFEEFVVGGRSLTYFGLFPSVLRMPVLAVTHRFDGRLTTLSMLAAYVVALAATALLVRRVRDLLCPGPWTPTAVVVASGLLVVVALGSTLTLLGATAWVYTEAALWGAAGALASFAALVGFLLRPERRRHVVAAGLWAAVAWLSRGSVGLAPTVALGLLGVAYLTGWRAAGWLAPLPPDPDPDPEPGPGRDRRTAAALLAAAVVPALAFMVVNMAKFGTPTTIPFARQINLATFPARRAALDEYGGNLFSPRLVLPNLVQMLRPDLVAPTRLWPFVALTHHGPPTFGGVVYDNVEPTVGLPTLAPVLLVLGIIGAVAILRPSAAAARLLRPLLIGGALAAAVPLTVAFVAQRYAADALPLLVTPACAGAVAVERWWTRRARTRVRPVVVAGGVLALAGIYVTLATSWLYGRIEAPPDPETRAAALETQAAVGDLPGVARVPVSRLGRLPTRAGPQGEVAVVGECAGLYRAGAGGWDTIEATAGGGHYRLRLSQPSRPAAAAAPTALLGLGDPTAHLVFGLEHGGDGRATVVLSTGGPLVRGEPVDLRPGREHDVEIWAEPQSRSVRAYVDGRLAFADFLPPPPAGRVAFGANPFGGPIADPPPGTVTERRIATPACRRLLDQG